MIAAPRYGFPPVRACILAAGLVATLASTASPANACGRDSDCAVDGGVYRVAVPDGWDGETPLPAAIFFHGYGSSANAVMSNDSLVRRFTDNGILLIAPNGLNKTWSHVGSPSQQRDELAFVDAVRADAMAQWPIDQSLFWVTGFSQGGSMAWDIACYRGDDYAAFAPIAGAFWEPQATSCPTQAVNIRHVHGTSDTVVPMEGRQIAVVFRQGNVLQAIDLWRRQDQCPAEPDSIVEDGGLECREWLSCSSGKQVELCLHDGGHSMPRGWFDGAWTWVQSLNG